MSAQTRTCCIADCERDVNVPARRCSWAHAAADLERRDVKLANSWIIINEGGGPTDDKPEVVLHIPDDPNGVSAFLNIRVADIQQVYADWSAKGATWSEVRPGAAKRSKSLIRRARPSR
jgi:hypothetical protein